MAKIKIDMTGVESFVKCEEGEHIAVLKSLDEKVASTGVDMLVAVFEVTQGKSKGAKVYHNFVLSEKALWNLKGYLEVLGVKSDGRIVLDPVKLVGRVCIIDVVHTEYNGTVRANIDSFKRLDTAANDVEEDYEDEDVEEETPAKKKEAKKKAPAKKKEAKKKEVVEDDEDEDWDEDWDEE